MIELRMTEMAALRCPSCGAAVAPQAVECGYCRVALHPIRCTWCFGWTFTETRDCSRCGSVVAPTVVKTSCPSCREPLAARVLTKVSLSGCGRCGGVWADPASFQMICDDREAQAAYLGEGSVHLAPKVSDPQFSPMVYRPCAVCGELMNRFNFANCSGVILDVCKPHWIWFDPDELRRIVAFIRGGGMDVARAKERRQLELERSQIEQVPAAVASARDLLRVFLGQ